MPRRNTRSKFLPATLEPTPGGAVAEVQEATTNYVRKRLSTISWDGAATAITSETVLMSGYFNLSDWNSTNAVIEWQVSGTMSTDAAAGVTSLRVNGEESDTAPSTLLTIGGNEVNSRTNDSWLYFGSVLIANGDVSAYGGRNSAAIYATQGFSVTSVVPVITVDITKQLYFEITIQSTDAGTTIDNMQGWMDVQFSDPLGTLTGGILTP